jgi:hypothetical protein
MSIDRRKLIRVVRWVVIAAIGVLAVFFVRKLDPAHALEVIATANVWWLLGAALLNATLRVGTRVLRTRSLLAVLPGAVPLRQLAEFVYGSMALGYVVSPVAGSAMRVFALQHHGVPSEAVVAVGLWEKVVTAATLAVFSGVMLAQDTPTEVHYSDRSRLPWRSSPRPCSGTSRVTTPRRARASVAGCSRSGARSHSSTRPRSSSARSCGRPCPSCATS